MTMRVHVLHPSLVHFPLALLPLAAGVDLLAPRRGHRAQGADRVGKILWWMTAGSGLVTGLAGMAASQEVKARDPYVRDMMWLHGAGNVVVVAGALGMALWRQTHRASAGQALLGLLASGLSLYTAYLGGELVYSHGVGVTPMPASADTGVQQSPPLFSLRAPPVLLRDMWRGLQWLISHARRAPDAVAEVVPAA
jgi:uncharacterized membrane protein